MAGVSTRVPPPGRLYTWRFLPRRRNPNRTAASRRRANRKYKPAIRVPPRVSPCALTPRLGRSERGWNCRGMPIDSDVGVGLTGSAPHPYGRAAEPIAAWSDARRFGSRRMRLRSRRHRWCSGFSLSRVRENRSDAPRIGYHRQQFVHTTAVEVAINFKPRNAK